MPGRRRAQARAWRTRAASAPAAASLTAAGASDIFGPVSSKDARPRRESGDAPTSRAPDAGGSSPNLPGVPRTGRARFIAAVIAIALVGALVWAQSPGAPAMPPVAPPGPSASAPTEEPVADGGKVEPRAVGAAHVLVTWKGAERAPAGVTRSKDAAKKRAEQAMADITTGKLDFAAAVRNYSDDASTVPSEGDIGNFERLVMPPAFSDTAFGLEPGQLSENIVETPLGFHILKRTR